MQQQSAFALVTAFVAGLVPSPAALRLAQNCACTWPAGTLDHSLITLDKAMVEPHNVYSRMTIGGSLISMTSGGKIAEGVVTVGGNYDPYFERQWIFKQPKPDSFEPIYASLSTVFNWSDFEALAQSIVPGQYPAGQVDRDCDDYFVFVLTTGGTFNLQSFLKDTHPDCAKDLQGEDNGKTLVVFNTNEPVTLEKHPNGRQFGPSVLAPFSTVTLAEDAGFIDGFIIAKNAMLFGSGNQMHGDAYKGPLDCQCTPSPTASPTMSPTTTLSPTMSPTMSPTTTPSPTMSPTTSTTAPATLPKTVTPSPTTSPTTTTPSPTMSPTMDCIPPRLANGSSQLPLCTDPPTPSPTMATVSGEADPHLVNVKSERFDLMLPGNHTFLLLPRGAPEEKAALQLRAHVTARGDVCEGKLYITGLNITGSWLGPVGRLYLSTSGESLNQSQEVLGLSAASSSKMSLADFLAAMPPNMVKAKQPKAKEVHGLNQHVTLLSVSLKFGPGVIMRVDWEHQKEKVGFSNWLKLSSWGLSRAQMKVGGLLGEDDHSYAMDLPKKCLETHPSSKLRGADNKARLPRANGMVVATASMDVASDIW